MGREPPEMPSPYWQPLPEDVRPLGQWGMEPGPPPPALERWRQRARWLWYGWIRRWRGLRVQSCPECGAERGFTLSPPPPPGPRPAALGPDPGLARNRQAEETAAQGPDTFYRHPEQSLQRVEWVRCVVCDTVVIDQGDIYAAHFHRAR